MALWTLEDTIRDLRKENEYLRAQLAVREPLLRLNNIRKIRRRILKAPNMDNYLEAMKEFKDCDI